VERRGFEPSVPRLMQRWEGVGGMFAFGSAAPPRSLEFQRFSQQLMRWSAKCATFQPLRLSGQPLRTDSGSGDGIHDATRSRFHVQTVPND